MAHPKCINVTIKAFNGPIYYQLNGTDTMSDSLPILVYNVQEVTKNYGIHLIVFWTTISVRKVENTGKTAKFAYQEMLLFN